MSKIIGVLILILLAAGVWELWSYYDKVNHDRDLAQKEAAAKTVVPEQLEGMPAALEPSYQAAQKAGPAAMKEWLRRYGPMLQDPRRAWIELEYMISISHDDPAEAKKIFAAVKGRTPENSPVYSRIKQLEKTYE
jgi:hypothetical protein